MIFSELELKRMLKAGISCVEEEIKFNILNFIHCIHLNKADFIKSTYATQIYGKLPMAFRKNAGQVVGIVTASVEDDMRIYVFTEHGYEALDSLYAIL